MVTPRTKIDRLGLSIRDGEGGRLRGFFAELYGHIGRPQFEYRNGAHGFRQGAVVTVAGANVAWCGWGGVSQRGRSFIDVTGLGCQLVRDWGEAQELVESMPDVVAKRVDIAADFYHGEVSYEDTLGAYQQGKLNRRGRPPGMRQILPGTPEEGRTLYIGTRGNDSMLRAYEKGKKEWQGLPRGLRESIGPGEVQRSDGSEDPFTLAEWFRIENELRAVKRPLPLDVIPMRDQYFAGSYPFLQEVLPDVEPLILVRPQDVASAELAKSLEGIRRQWGTTLFTALVVEQGDISAVWEKIVGDKHNDRLLKAGVLLPG